MFALFKKPNIEQLTVNEQRLITALIEIRQAAFKPSVVNQKLLATDLPALKQLLKRIGFKILSANSKNDADFLNKITVYGSVLDCFFQEHPIITLANYAAQLMQYFTIICDNELTESQDFQALMKFLHTNEEKFGDSENNLFIIELKLITLYNNLVSTIDSLDERSDGNLEANYLMNNLNELRQTIETLKKNVPDSLFVHYLSFSLNYATAKAYELQYKLLRVKSESNTQQELELAHIQEHALKLASEDIKNMKGLELFYAAQGLKYPKGYEYSLGLNPLDSLPSSDLNVVEEHVSNLLNNTFS